MGWGYPLEDHGKTIPEIYIYELLDWINVHLCVSSEATS